MGVVGSANPKSAPREGPDDESPDLCPPCVLPLVRRERPKVRQPWTGFSGSAYGHSSGGESAGQTGPSGLFPESWVCPLYVGAVAVLSSEGSARAWSRPDAGRLAVGAGAWEPCGLRASTHVPGADGLTAA